ncbi:phosphate ABC transporter ATP-binding protein [bacterium]|nr:phosphate ABC transporter ATP-binding protein [bacterium]
MNETIKMETQNVNFYYGDNQVLKNITIKIPANRITAIIGPSGCGKSTFLRLFNRMNDILEGARLEGKVLIDGVDIYDDKAIDVAMLRRRVGMVFQRPNPFPMSIFDNVAYGPRIHGLHKKKNLKEIVENALRQAALWDEVKDKLYNSAMELSGGQQQRLCIARCLAVEPEVILMDEPASALDPISTLRIEELMQELKEKYTIVIVTHNMQEAARVSDYTGFIYRGELIEFAPTVDIFEHPQNKLTEEYITGRFG